MKRSSSPGPKFSTTPIVGREPRRSRSRSPGPTMMRRQNKAAAVPMRRRRSSGSGELFRRALTDAVRSTSPALRKNTKKYATLAKNSKWGQHVQHTLRPWREFVLPLHIPDDFEQAYTMARQNFTLFQTNYGVLFLVYLIFNLVTSTSSLVGIVGIAITWLVFLQQNKNPRWRPLGLDLSPSQRWMVLFALTGVAIMVTSSHVIFSSCLGFSMASLLHACIHGGGGGGMTRRASKYALTGRRQSMRRMKSPASK